MGWLGSLLEHLNVGDMGRLAGMILTFSNCEITSVSND